MIDPPPPATRWRLPGRRPVASGICHGALLAAVVWASAGRQAHAAPTPSLLPQAAPVVAPVAAPPLDDAAFAAALPQADLERLYGLCRQSVAEDRQDRLRQLQARLLAIHPAPQPLGVVLANAEALLGCLAPEAALTVLDRIGPAPGRDRIQWLIVQWRAASAGLDHRRASLALERLAAALADGGTLETQQLPMRRRDDGSVPMRAALDELAEHLAARGQLRQAAQLLLASRRSGAAGAERLRLAAGWGADLSLEQREALLEQALDQAAAVQAWGLVNDLLDDQLALPVARARERRLRLAPRLDDAYGEWLLRRGDPASLARARELERLLRSPRAPGGHAAALSDPLAPAAPAAATTGEPPAVPPAVVPPLLPTRP